MVEISIKLDSFEGPLELLYHLIEKNEIDIYDIPISLITKQYIDTISNFSPDMESLSSFLLMAATLLEIKSKMLLPAKEKDSKDEPDPREALIERLLEYKKFREISETLRDMGTSIGTSVFKEADLTIKELFESEPINVSDVLKGISLNRLFEVFTDVLSRKELKVDKIRSTFSHVKRDLFTVEDKISHLKSILKFRGKITFTELLENGADKPEMVVTFLALLELIKIKEVKISQQDIFCEILILRND